MLDLDDMALLREYAANNSEAAFAELVARRVGFVYSAALRQIRDPHQAEEITQAVFIILAQKAGRISNKTILAGWLFKTTRYTALAQTRAATKRRRRELEVQMQTELSSAAPDPLWERMSPLLDEALTSLGETDRQAVLLRFFENKTLAEVGSHLGTGEDTARKRVARALEKLHRYFNKRGVSSTTAIIAGAISANSVHAAPVALAKSVATVAIAKGATASGATLTLIKGALKVMAWTKAKTAIAIGTGILLAVGTTTITVKEIQKHRTYPWQIRDYDPRVLEQAPPQVRILPSKYHANGGFGTSLGKIMGVGEPATAIVEAAYDWYYIPRVVLTTELPNGSYDFIASLSGDNRNALQDEVKRKFGVMAKLETRETDVWLLKIKFSNAPGVRSSANSQGQTRVGRSEITLVNDSLSHLAYYLENVMRTLPILDRTGLTDDLDINLKWDDGAGDQPHNLENLKQALLDQLGLELVRSREPVEMLVIEKAR